MPRGKAAPKPRKATKEDLPIEGSAPTPVGSLPNVGPAESGNSDITGNLKPFSPIIMPNGNAPPPRRGGVVEGLKNAPSWERWPSLMELSDNRGQVPAGSFFQRMFHSPYGGPGWFGGSGAPPASGSVTGSYHSSRVPSLEDTSSSALPGTLKM